MESRKPTNRNENRSRNRRRPSPSHAELLKPAGSLRVSAFFTDVTFLIILIPLVFGMWFVILPILAELEGKELPFTIFFCALHLYVALILYKPMMEFFYGSTFGGVPYGLCVTDGSGRMIGVRAAFVRNMPVLLLIVPVVPVGVGVVSLQPVGSALIVHYAVVALLVVVDLICMLAHPQKRGVFDLLAGTHCFISFEGQRRREADRIRKMRRLEYKRKYLC